MNDVIAVTTPAAASATRLKLERHGHVLVLTLDDPSTGNALYGDDLFRAFEDVTQRATADRRTTPRSSPRHNKSACQSFRGDRCAIPSQPQC